MKLPYKIILGATFLVTIVSCTEKYSTLILEFKNEKKLSDNFPELYKLEIKKNGKIIKTVLPKEGLFIENPLKIDSIEKGTYEFIYSDLFGRTQIKKYKAENFDKVDTLRISPDHIDITKVKNNSIIRKLNNNQITIKYRSQGCFHKIKDSIVIKNKDGKYYLGYNGRFKTLSKDEIDKIIQFECELYTLPKDGGCTTVSIYTLFFNGETKEIQDGNCGWNGWDNLKNDLKIKN
ncbi:hypothetical protein [Chryseobacterium balustinum]|uniref:hypothetical protein n=1 Tax=Chryseobacterium balustinum TaxID=246 RepID=UPI003CF42C13